jgi:Asp-tRNA(Asn)/Glu-tRNA(Gln) amidotransferase A subunit family amidase
MKISEFADLDATAVAGLIESNQITPTEALETTLELIDTRDSQIRAVWTVLADRALRSIKNGLPNGPFRGVPFAVKDLGLKIEGEVTTHGSSYFLGDVSEFSSELTKRYDAAGLVICAKVSTSEFGLGPSADTDLHPRTNNPWDHSRVAGGSSTGSAAAVSSGTFSMAHASDGGGSIRIPAACCGVFGFKPSRGRISYSPVAEPWSGMSTQHAITRTVRDSAQLLDCTAGNLPGDPYFCPPAEGTFLSASKTEPRQLSIGVHLMSADGIHPDPEIAQRVNDMAILLESLGHRVSFTDLDFNLTEVARLYGVITSTSVKMMIDERAQKTGRQPNSDELLSISRLIAERGDKYRGVDLALAREACFAASRNISVFTEKFDVVLCPTIATLPPKHGTYDMRSSNVEDYMSSIFKFAPYTALASIAGQPAMNMPFGFSVDGLPIGVHFSSAFAQDALLFSLAGQLERTGLCGFKS